MAHRARQKGRVIRVAVGQGVVIVLEHSTDAGLRQRGHVIGGIVRQLNRRCPPHPSVRVISSSLLAPAAPPRPTLVLILPSRVEAPSVSAVAVVFVGRHRGRSLSSSALLRYRQEI